MKFLNLFVMDTEDSDLRIETQDTIEQGFLVVVEEGIRDGDFPEVTATAGAAAMDAWILENAKWSSSRTEQYDRLFNEFMDRMYGLPGRFYTWSGADADFNLLFVYS